MERRSEWKFLAAEDGWLWAVTHPDGTEAAAARSFPTLKDCTEDARKNGYIMWTPEQERRV